MAIGGSIIIEVIFTIPGMGTEVFNSVINGDYPMIITVFTISGFLTMIGYLVSDILYSVADPKFLIHKQYEFTYYFSDRCFYFLPL